jgi:hypothetical protein
MELKEQVISTLEVLIQKMKINEGISLAMSQKLTFEKWLQIELAGELSVRLKNQKSLRVILEAPVSGKISKKGPSIDIGIHKANEKLFSIELKIIATNYNVEGIDKKTKGLTDKVDELIDDLDKARNDGYTEYMSLAFVFPFPVKKNHPNNIRDFPKQVRKLSEHGEVNQFTFTFNRNYNVAFVSLYGKKIIKHLNNQVIISSKANLELQSPITQKKETAKSTKREKRVISKKDGNDIVSFKLGKEYYMKGIIAFSKEHDKHLPRQSGTKVKIFTSNGDIEFTGNFTRSSDGNRRFINGYDALASYFKQNFNLGDYVKVRILNDTEYILMSKLRG